MDKDFEAALHLGTRMHAAALSQTVEELWRKEPEEQKGRACMTLLFDAIIMSLCNLSVCWVMYRLV